jgi:hypothetical protein
VIFEGKTEKVELQGWPLRPEPGKTISIIPRMRVTFSGVRLYRGLAQEFVIETGLGGGDCGYRFEPGKSYLVYARHEDSGDLSTGICSPTSLLQDAGTALRLLRGDPLTPEDLADLPGGNKSPASRTLPDYKLCGRLLFPSGKKAKPLTLYFWPADQDPNPLPADDAESEEDGSFCVQGLEPGKYLIEAVEAPSGNDKFRYTGFFPGVKDRGQAQSVLFQDEGGSRRADFSVFRQPLYHVRGHLHGVPEGGNEDLRVMVMGSETDILQTVEPVHLGPHGFFEIRGLPPGKYSVFALRDNDDEDDTITVLSEVVDLDLQNDIDGLQLEFVPVR